VLALSAVAVYGVLLAGWSSGSKYPLLGGIRASAQLISYEAAFSLSVAAAVLITGSLSTRAIVAAQNGVIRGFIPNWNVFRLGFVPFLVFMVASTAEMNRPPFDLVEAEQELVGGFHTEYSSLRFALFQLTEFMGSVTMSAIAVTLFLGGPDGPGFHVVRWVWPILWFAGKVIVLLFVQVWLRATLPRLRYDQLMGLGWKFLIPISLGWLLVIAAMRVSLGWGLVVVGLGIVFGAMLVRAMTVSGRQVGEAYN
jgi:NADH-quinone oxidoreductase subunit H